MNKNEYDKKYYQEHKEAILNRNKQYKIDNPDYEKDYYIRNKKTKLEYRKLYCEKNKEKIKEQKRQYYQNNREKIGAQRRVYSRLRNKVDLRFNLNHRIKVVMSRSLKGNKAGRRWEDLVGYTLDDLIKRLKKTMPEGYTWQDYLEGKLHIDHIIPKSVFNYTKPEHPDFKRCWALKNLQLLPARENIIKSNHLEKPFQPALAI